MSTDLQPAPASEIAPAEAQAAAAALAGLDAKDVVLPAIVVTQQLSDAVMNGDADSGVFLNTLTGEDLGDATELVIVHYFKGRFFKDKDENVYVASEDTAPSNWPDEYAGRLFVEIEDAEESFRDAVNAGTREWESGPPISTTHNYIGFLPDEPDIPVRLSLMRTSAPAARKINTLIRFGNAPWAATIALNTKLESDGKKPYYVVQAKRGRPCSDDERAAAVSLSNVVREAQSAGQTQLTGDASAEVKSETAAAVAEDDDGLDVT